MAFQTVFKRYEIKYILTREQKEAVLRAMEPYMILDKFGRSAIRNIYFDTDDYILARHSIAKPDFKEKLRIRSYSQAGPDEPVFVELKRKYDHVVYKRRVALPEREAMDWMSGRSRGAGAQTEKIDAVSPQMVNEIQYFLDFYKNLRPAMFLSYEREAYRVRRAAAGHADRMYCDRTPEDFRVTFDENILCRDYDISLGSDVYGASILEPGMTLMEIKCSGGMPLWMTEVLTREHIYKTSFSKYGIAYTRFVLPELYPARRIAVYTPEREAEQTQRKAVFAMAGA